MAEAQYLIETWKRHFNQRLNLYLLGLPEPLGIVAIGFYGDRLGRARNAPIMRDQIEHFFRHYKDLEKDKWVKGLRWVARDDAYDLIRRAISRFQTI